LLRVGYQEFVRYCPAYINSFFNIQTICYYRQNRRMCYTRTNTDQRETMGTRVSKGLNRKTNEEGKP
jgi:hypothetical protein